MFLRKKAFKNKDGSVRTYLQLVESYRYNGKIKQRVIATLGRLEDLYGSQIDEFIKGFARFTDTQWIRVNKK